MVFYTSLGTRKLLFKGLYWRRGDAYGKIFAIKHIRTYVYFSILKHFRFNSPIKEPKLLYISVFRYIKTRSRARIKPVYVFAFIRDRRLSLNRVILNFANIIRSSSLLATLFKHISRVYLLRNEIFDRFS